MELHQLRYLVAVAHAGSFSRAAAQCNVAQPSLSQQIQKLEEELGEPLFRRSSKGALLTPAGEVLAARAVRILREVEDARGEICDSTGDLRGSISIGVIPTIAPYFLPAVLERFANAHPGVDLVIHEDTTAQLEHKVAQMEIDLAVASLPLDESRFAVRPLFTEELVLAMPSSHALATKKRISLADLEGERFILMKEGHCLGTQALNLCQQAKLIPHVALRSAQIETIHSLVAAGFGISLIPQMAVPAHGRPEPIFRSLVAPTPSRAIAAFHHKDAYLNRASIRLLELLQSPHLEQAALPTAGSLIETVPLLPRAGLTPPLIFSDPIARRTAPAEISALPVELILRPGRTPQLAARAFFWSDRAHIATWSQSDACARSTLLIGWSSHCDGVAIICYPAEHISLSAELRARLDRAGLLATSARPGKR